MSNDLWFVKEHVINAAYVRDFARGVKNEETDRLRLSVKQWIPKANSASSPGGITIVFCQGVGSSKETYEPFFEGLLKSCSSIRSVWAMDVAWHGASYMLNKNVVGDEPSWVDSSRDLIHVINTFQQDMPAPIVAVTQSWGASAAMLASSMHPRLFAGLVIMEPAFTAGFRGEGKHRKHRAVWMATRQDNWPSMQAAREYLREVPHYKRFDSRVFELVLQYELRKIPKDQSLTPERHTTEAEGPHVTLTTPKAMEVYTMMRPGLSLPGVLTGSEDAAALDLVIVPGFYRPELWQIEKALPHIHPPVLYVWGEESDFPKRPGYCSHLLETTGTGPGGSGGKESGLVSETWIPGCQHPLPFEKPDGTARAIAPWIATQAARWRTKSRAARGNEFYTATVNPGWIRKLQKL